jgi:hypothetical protein
MSTNELSEKKRLNPVICTILKLTQEERNNIDSVLLTEEADNDDFVALANIGTSLFSSVSSSFFGSNNAENK